MAPAHTDRKLGWYRPGKANWGAGGRDGSFAVHISRKAEGMDLGALGRPWKWLRWQRPPQEDSERILSCDSEKVPGPSD